MVKMIDIMAKSKTQQKRREEFGEILKHHVDVAVSRNKISKTSLANLIDSQLSQLTDNLGGRKLFPFAKLKKLIEVCSLKDEDAFELMSAWFEAKLADSDFEVIACLKELSQKAVQGESKYYFLNLAEHEHLIEEFLKDNLEGLSDKKTLSLLGNPACLKALNVTAKLTSNQQKSLFELLETIRKNPAKLDLILGLLQ